MFDLLQNNFMITLGDKSMGLATRRMALIASNIANIDTPGYQTKDFNFNAALKQALDAASPPANTQQVVPSHVTLASTHPLHIQGTVSTEAFLSSNFKPKQPPIYERNDGNDVNIDQQSMALANAQGAYTKGALFAQTELRKIYSMINELKK